MALKRLNKLKERRERRGVTQEDLAVLAGVSRSTIAGLESGSRKARPASYARLAKALKTRPDKLY